MRTRHVIVAFAACMAVFGLSSCDEEPTGIAGSPPIIVEYRPLDSLLVTDLGHAVTFSVDAVDPDGDRLSQYFTLDGVVVSRDPSWRHVVADTGMATVGFVVSDGEHEVQVEWVLSRHHINRPPLIQSFLPTESTLNATVGEALEFSVDTTDPDGDPIDHFFRIDGALASTESGVVFTPTRPGRVAVEAFAWDGELVVTHRWMVNVDGPVINRTPTIYLRLPADDTPAMRSDDDMEFRIHAYDPDGDPLDYQFQLDGAEVSTTSTFLFHSTEAGTFNLTATVSDGEFTPATAWTITVADNQPLTLVNVSPTLAAFEVTTGTSAVFSVDAIDLDGDPINYTYTLDGEIVKLGKFFVYTPTVAGNYTVRVEATDGEFVVSHTWSVTAVEEAVNHPPRFSAYTPGAVELLAFAGEAVDFVVQAVDPDDDPLDVGFYVDGVRVHTASTFSFVGAVGVYDIEARVTDGEFMNAVAWTLTLLDPTESLRGRVRDAVTSAALPGLSVEVALREATTDALGQFEFPGLPPYGGTLMVRDETVDEAVGEYFDYVHAYGISDGSYLDIFLLPNISVTSAYYSDFHQLFRSLTDIPGIPASTGQRRWELPLQVNVPAYTSNGLDYRATVIEVMAEFDALLGQQVFRLVGGSPDVGVNIAFSPGIYADNYRVEQWSPDYYPLQGLIQFRTHYAPATVEPFKVIVRHEFGHALGLSHSVDRRHLMVGGQTPATSTFTQDELNVLHARYAIPRGHEMLDHIRD